MAVQVQAGERPPIPAGTPQQLADTMAKCWAQEASDRPAPWRIYTSRFLHNSVKGGGLVFFSFFNRADNAADFGWIHDRTLDTFSTTWISLIGMCV